MLHRRVLLLTLLLMTFCLPLELAAQDEQRGDIVCHVIAFRNTKGTIELSLYDQAQGFPNDFSKRIETKIVKVNNRQATEVVFKNVPYGTYAIAGLHDENSNRKMDYNWLGLPLEGYCFSNDAEPFLSAPSFKAAKFTVSQPRNVLYIGMQY